MSLNFTVTKVEGYQPIPDGSYTAQVNHIEYMRHNYGNFIIVNWKILSPSEHENRIHQERYQIEHENEQVRSIAINNFSRFCQDIGELKEGDKPTEENFLYKIATIYIKTRHGKKDGKAYTNITSMELASVSKSKETLGQVLEQTKMGVAPQNTAAPATPGAFINDEVPF
jgi:hypothetical protein